MRVGATAAALLAVVTACGGDDDGGGEDVCGQQTACGGDPVGEWRAVGQCFELSLGSECPELTLEGERVVTGTLDVRAGIYTADLTRTLDVSVTFPMSCFGENTCEDFEATLGSCELMGDVCSCVTDRIDDDDDQGQWYVSETSIGLVSDSGSGGLDRSLELGDFCVDGDRMAIAIDGEAFPFVFTGHIAFERVEQAALPAQDGTSSSAVWWGGLESRTGSAAARSSRPRR